MRQTGPAFESPEFRKAAMGAFTAEMIAHVRRATIGGAALKNTHPFAYGREALAHNGHIGSFERVRAGMLENMSPAHTRAIEGDTDSEHFFHLLLSRAEREPEASRGDILCRTIQDVEGRVSGLARPEMEDEVALNVLWLTPGELTGSRHGRTLWVVERHRPHVCEVHGIPHVSPPAGDEYRAVVVASDPITGEEWKEIPDGCIFSVGKDVRLNTTSADAG